MGRTPLARPRMRWGQHCPSTKGSPSTGALAVGPPKPSFRPSPAPAHHARATIAFRPRIPRFARCRPQRFDLPATGEHSLDHNQPPHTHRPPTRPSEFPTPSPSQKSSHNSPNPDPLFPMLTPPPPMCILSPSLTKVGQSGAAEPAQTACRPLIRWQAVVEALTMPRHGRLRRSTRKCVSKRMTNRVGRPRPADNPI